MQIIYNIDFSKTDRTLLLESHKELPLWKPSFHNESKWIMSTSRIKYRHFQASLYSFDQDYRRVYHSQMSIVVVMTADHIYPSRVISF